MLRGYLLDLDGTVYLGDHLIDGAAETIAALRERGRRIVLSGDAGSSFLRTNRSILAPIMLRSSAI